MYQNNYRITDDGFGIHTFELTIPSITRKEFERISNNAEKKYACNNGNRIYLNHTDLNFYNIKVIVAPRQLIDCDAEAVSIFRESDDIDLLEEMLNDVFGTHLGKEYTVDSFSLSRVDLCVNIMLSEAFSAERYVKLIKRSMIYNDNAEIITFPEDVPEASEKNKHSFRINTGCTTFTAYDKYFQLEDIGENYEAVSESLLRLELAINRDMLREIRNVYSRDIGNIEMIGYMTFTSGTWFEEYIKKHFLPGDYHYLSNMKTAIERSMLSTKLKNRMLEYSDIQWGKRSFTAVQNEILKQLGSDYKMKKMFNAFKCLDVYPISLAYRDKHGEKAVPGLYKIFKL